MSIESDLIAAGVKLRQRQEKAKAELEAERVEMAAEHVEKERLREERALAFWKETAPRETNEAAILPWPKKEAK